MISSARSLFFAESSFGNLVTKIRKKSQKCENQLMMGPRIERLYICWKRMSSRSLQSNQTGTYLHFSFGNWVACSCLRLHAASASSSLCGVVDLHAKPQQLLERLFWASVSLSKRGGWKCSSSFPVFASARSLAGSLIRLSFGGFDERIDLWYLKKQEIRDYI